MAKAKVANLKVDKEAATASLRETRTQTRAEGTPILPQGGTLSPLVGNPTRDLRPVPRRKANKNKGNKRAIEDGDQSNARKRSHFMCMARKLQKKGFEVTCAAVF